LTLTENKLEKYLIIITVIISASKGQVMTSTVLSVVGAGIGGAVLLLALLGLAVMFYVCGERRAEVAIRKESVRIISSEVLGHGDFTSVSLLRQSGN
jgi:hypothetical protein